MKFLVLGAGGVGGYFGAKLSVAGEDVHFVARGTHLQAMKQNGLSVRSTNEDFRIPPEKIHGDVSEVDNPDLVLLCVKAYDTDAATRQLLPTLQEHSVVMSLQNGIDNEEVIQRRAPGTTVYGGVAYIYSTITSPGVITRNEGPAKIVFGPMDHRVDGTSKTILETLRKAGINADLSSDIRTEIWKKFTFITAVSGITALTRLTLGEILANAETRDLVREAMKETYAVAKAKHITLEANLIDSFFETMSRFTNDTRSSLYYDLANGKPMELDTLAGTVVKLGRELGVPTPIQKTIYASLLPYHLRHVQVPPKVRSRG